MEGAKTVFTESSRSINLTRVKGQNKLEKCTVFRLDSFTKYSIFKIPKDQCLYAKNIHFRLIICGGDEFRIFLNSRIKLAETNIGREIMLNDSGYIDFSIVKDHNDLKNFGSINAVNTDVSISAYDMIPSAYQQKSYPTSNSCVWLSIF